MSTCAVCHSPTDGGKVVCSTDCLKVWGERVEQASERTRQAYGDAMMAYGAYQRGELEAEGLEAKARILAGYDPGEMVDLTPEEREYMARDAQSCDPAYDYETGIELMDAPLSRWWLGAMKSYVDDLFG